MIEQEITSKQIKTALKVIKAAKKLGVIKLKLGTLEFELNNEPRVPRPTLKVSKKKIDELNEKNEAQLKFNEAREDLSVMHVEDPLGFERALIDKELEDDSSATGGEEIEETFGI